MGLLIGRSKTKDFKFKIVLEGSFNITKTIKFGAVQGTQQGIENDNTNESRIRTRL